MEPPFEHLGSPDTCLGCGEIIVAHDLVAALAPERPDRIVCVGCWWLDSCDLPLPAWGR